MSFIEWFLVINALLLGVVITLAVQYGLAHRRQSKGATSSTRPTPSGPTALSPIVKERLSKQAEANFKGIVNRSGLQLQHDLSATGSQLNKLLEKFGTEVLDEEMRLFRQNVADIRAATQGTLSGAQDVIAEQQAAIVKSLSSRQAELTTKLAERQEALEAELEQSFAIQEAALSDRLNQKLNDAVLAFLIESLGHDVDLGAQSDYLIATLDANKSDLLSSVAQSRPPKKAAS